MESNNEIGCGDNSCIFSDAIADKGMGTISIIQIPIQYLVIV
jgi:hypothetical protein